MLVKCYAVIFAFPCTTILLTNSAVSLRILGTLNGVATSISAIGRALGPAIVGGLFEVGSKKKWAILPWWVLAAFAILGAIPVWWVVEMDGFGGGTEGSNSDDEDDGDGAEPEVPRAEEGDLPEPLVAAEPESPKRSIAQGEDDRSTTQDEDTRPSLSRTGRSNTGTNRIGMGLRRMSSPIGLMTSPGPGGNTLSNGLGHSRSGFGAGGTSYH